MKTEILVIGSGPGGAVAACELAEAGRQVLILEGGPALSQDSCRPFSVPEVETKYRNGGLTFTFGNPKISYAEGKCLGGGSEVNAGLYHRIPEEVIAGWRAEYQLDGATADMMDPIYSACESEIGLTSPDSESSYPPFSLKLALGAEKQGWKTVPVPRLFKDGSRQSMSKTFLPRAVLAGAKIVTDFKATRMRQQGSKWIVHAKNRDTGAALEIEAETVFVACGAIQTAALLRKNGIGTNIGNQLQLHPTVKIVAQFDEVVNTPTMGFPVHQVKEFSPHMSFGCSVSSPPFLSVGLLDFKIPRDEFLENWGKMAIYYSMIIPEGTGTVRSVPLFQDPLTRYHLAKEDLKNLADGLKKLALMLLDSGAKRLFPSITGSRVLKSKADLSLIPDLLVRETANLMTIHLFSSCPMGENRKICATDSFGKVHGFQNLFISDASLLCTAPGVNPQGAIMAISKRNARKFLGRL